VVAGGAAAASPTVGGAPIPMAASSAPEVSAAGRVLPKIPKNPFIFVLL